MPLAYMTLGMLASSAQEHATLTEKIGLWGRRRIVYDHEEYALRQRKLDVLGRFLPYFAPVVFEVASKD